MSVSRYLSFLLSAVLLACSAPPSLESSVRWLAADSQQGRRAGTVGAKRSAGWIANQLRNAGLRPGSETGWLQSFAIPLPPSPGPCSLHLEGRSLGPVATLMLTASGKVQAPLVAAGYGMVLPSHGMDDFAELDAEGKVVLLRRYTPMGPKAPPELARLGALRTKIRAARNAGAAAIIVGTHPDDLAAGGEATIAFSSVPGTAGIPVLAVTPKQFLILEEAVGKTVQLLAGIETREAQTNNVLGVIPGKSSEVIVLGAHYDHLGFGGEGSLAPGSTAIHNGADDNASGTAVVLEVARRFAAGATPERTILIALWGAEEQGLLGSQYFVQNPTLPAGDILANVNLDMVGRLQDGRITVGSHATAAAFGAGLLHAQSMAPNLKFHLSKGSLPGGGGSDHMSFHSVKIPALFFFSGLHADYHKPSDDWEKLDYSRMEELVDATVGLISALSEEPKEAFAWQAPLPAAGQSQAREVRAAQVWFGSIPDYGADPKSGGMAIAGVSPGGPAEKAGLQGGDIILKVGEFEIADIYDFMDSLTVFENGQTIPVRILREGRIQTQSLTFFPRPAVD